jgi:putative oxidoreductase
MDIKMKSLLFGGAKFNSVAGDFGLLVFRVFVGLSLALAHGWGKVPPGGEFVKGVTALGFPAEAAWLTMLTEFFGGLALAAGFATRPAALAMIVNFSVAGFMAHAADPYLRKELPFMFLAAAIMFLFVGAGRFSIDRLLKK